MLNDRVKVMEKFNMETEAYSFILAQSHRGFVI